MKYRPISIAAGLLTVAALTLGTSLPAEAVTIYAGARSCNSGYEAYSGGFYQYVGTHHQLTGSTWFAETVSSTYKKWNYGTAGTQSFTNSYVDSYSLTNVSTKCA